jgi:REP element-mobilizing transposase RayT
LKGATFPLELGVQLAMTLNTWGGRRFGAGRKRVGRGRVARRVRPRLGKGVPVHVTMRCARAVGSMRRRAGYQSVRAALRVMARHVESFRVVQISIQRDHLHMIVEAADAGALSRGMVSFATSCARQVNRRLGRRGTVFADRYHAGQLPNPRQVRHALAYVLNNWRKHRVADAGLFDPCSSARAFDGWTLAPTGASDLPVASPRSWLLTTGWRRHRPIDPLGVPGSPSPSEK